MAICQSLLLRKNGEIDSSGDFVDKYGWAFSSKTKPEEIRPILSAKGAAMIVKKDIFWELGGFDKEYFFSFEDVDLGWRAWIWGYKVILVPKSVVYHDGKQTTTKLKSTVDFHSVKNSMILQLVNFEGWISVRNFVTFLFVNIKQKISGSSMKQISGTVYSMPSFKIAFKSLRWILRNNSYICKKQKIVKKNRVRTTKDLMDLGLIGVKETI